MSWDLTAFKRPADPEQQDWQPQPLGTVEEVRRLFEQDPRFDFDFYYCCWIEGEGFQIEFSIGDSNSEDTDILDHLAIEVRGGGDPIPLLCELARKHDWVLEDLATVSRPHVRKPVALPRRGHFFAQGGATWHPEREPERKTEWFSL